MTGSVGMRRGALRGVIALALLLGLVGMHHVVNTAPAAAPPAMTAPVAASSATVAATAVDHAAHSGGGAHEHSDVLHLCAAVLAAVVITAFGVGLRWRAAVHVVARRRGPVRPRTSSRAPPPPVPRRLAQLCVLRT